VRLGGHTGELIDDYNVCRTPIVRARCPGTGCPGTAADRSRRARATRVGARPTYEQQQGKINAWTVGDAAGLIEGADTGHLHHRARWRVDDGTNVAVLPIVRLGTTERLYLRGADLAIVNSGACSLLAQAERIECLEKLSRNIAPPAVSPSSDLRRWPTYEPLRTCPFCLIQLEVVGRTVGPNSAPTKGARNTMLEGVYLADPASA